MNKWKRGGKKPKALTHGLKANRSERKSGAKRRLEETGISDAKREMKEREGWRVTALSPQSFHAGGSV